MTIKIKTPMAEATVRVPTGLAMVLCTKCGHQFSVTTARVVLFEQGADIACPKCDSLEVDPYILSESEEGDE